MLRTIDVIAAKKLEEKSDEDPVTIIDVKFLMQQAKAGYSTLMNRGFHWDVHSQAGGKYMKNKGKYKIKCATWLRGRKRRDEIDRLTGETQEYIFMHSDPSDF